MIGFQWSLALFITIDCQILSFEFPATASPLLLKKTMAFMAMILA